MQAWEERCIIVGNYRYRRDALWEVGCWYGRGDALWKGDTLWEEKCIMERGMHCGKRDAGMGGWCMVGGGVHYVGYTVKGYTVGGRLAEQNCSATSTPKILPRPVPLGPMSLADPWSGAAGWNLRLCS